MGACLSRMGEGLEAKKRNSTTPSSLAPPPPTKRTKSTARFEVEAPSTPPATREKSTNESSSSSHRHIHLRGFLHRINKENALSWLIRHPHHHHFEEVDRYGLDGSFKTIQIIGRGGTGITILAEDECRPGAKKYVAIKLQQRPVSKLLGTMSYNEISFQGNEAEGCSTFLVTIREVALTPTHQAQIMEYCNGGNLAEYVAARMSTVPSDDMVLSEDEARFFYRQVVMGLAYMHSRGTAHRDVKLDNAMLHYGAINTTTSTIATSTNATKAPTPPPNLKLGDFQFVYSVKKAPLTKTHLGTPVYMSPELLQARFRPEERAQGHAYDPMLADVWASGIMLLATLVGAFPFDHTPNVDTATAEREILKELDTMSWKESPFVRPYLSKFSPSLVALLDGILERDPEMRISMSACVRSPWVCAPLTEPFESAYCQLMDRQIAVEREVQSIKIDQGLMAKRNKAVWEMVEAAGVGVGEGMTRVMDARFIDHRTIPHGVLIDMLLSAIAASVGGGCGVVEHRRHHRSSSSSSR